MAYRIEGGAPAGINILAGEDGCRTTSTSINIITMIGKSRTAPRGMEILELPLSRIRRRKNASLGVMRSLWRDKSPREGSFSRVGRLGDEGILFTRFCTNPIEAK